jgi:hypothetical protein
MALVAAAAAVAVAVEQQQQQHVAAKVACVVFACCNRYLFWAADKKDTKKIPRYCYFFPVSQCD